MYSEATVSYLIDSYVYVFINVRSINKLNKSGVQVK